MTLYLLDANVLIRAHQDYYPLDRIPPFWTWLLEQCAAGTIKMPRAIYNEVAQSSDLLGQWMRQTAGRDVLILDEPADRARLRHVIDHGYAPDLDDVELEKIGRDPFLIAAALTGSGRVVVTREVSRPGVQRANRKVPDVCAAFRILAINDFGLYQELRFRIA